MKNLILRFCRWALPFFGVSAAVSCDNVFTTPDMYGTMVAEYGVPVMEFVVKGKVTDADTGMPIQGVQVTASEDCSSMPVLTTENGDFECKGEGWPDGNVSLTFTDIDGEENGLYKSCDLEVIVEKIKEGSGWNEGVYAADEVMVKMQPEETDK